MTALLVALALVSVGCGPGHVIREPAPRPAVPRSGPPPWTQECGPARCGDGEITRCEVVAPCEAPLPAPGTGSTLRPCTFQWEEQCDPAAGRVPTCEELGMKGGPVGCSSDCRLQTSRCCYRPPPEQCPLEARFCFRARTGDWWTPERFEDERCEATELECRENRARALGGELGVEVSRAGPCAPKPRIGQTALESWPAACGCRFASCEDNWSCTGGQCGDDTGCTTVPAPAAPPPVGDLPPLFCLERIWYQPAPCPPGTPCPHRRVRRGVCFETLAECRTELRGYAAERGVRVFPCRSVPR